MTLVTNNSIRLSFWITFNQVHVCTSVSAILNVFLAQSKIIPDCFQVRGSKQSLQQSSKQRETQTVPATAIVS